MPLPTIITKGNLRPALPSTDKHYNASLKTLEAQTPIDYIMEWVKQRYPGVGRRDNDEPTMSDRVLILRSKTGSGKSTVVPPMLYKTFIYGRPSERNLPAVLCTQPRVVTAKELAVDAAAKSYYVKLELGENVGYKTGSLTERAKYGLTYATIGVLLQQLRMRDDELIMRKYRFIVLDEVHERSEAMDTAAYLLRAFMRRVLPSPRAPFVIMMSATFEPEKYAKFFGVYDDIPKQITPDVYGQPNIIEVEGFAFPVEYHWPKRAVDNWHKAAADTAITINKDNQDDKPDQADIIIFLPGEADIKAVEKLLSGNPELLVLRLTREEVMTDSDNYRMVFMAFDELPKCKRRVILATNVAETGLTVETAKYVIDPGWNNSMEFNPDGNIKALIMRPAPRSRILQRRGRVGRKAPGEFFPLYTEETFNALPEIQPPDVLQSDIAQMMLDIVSLYEDGLFIADDIIDKMLDPPSGQSLCNALSRLTTIGLVAPVAATDADVKDICVTQLGTLASRFSKMSVESIRLLLNGYVDYPLLDGVRPKVAMRDLITLAAIINADARLVFKTEPKNMDKLMADGCPTWITKEASTSNVWRACQDELIMELFVFNAMTRALIDGGDPSVWASEHGLFVDSLKNIANTRSDIIAQMMAIGLDIKRYDELSITERDGDEAKGKQVLAGLKRAIHAGYCANMLQHKDNGKYEPMYIHSRAEGIPNMKWLPPKYMPTLRDIYGKSGWPKYITAAKWMMRKPPPMRSAARGGYDAPTGFSAMTPVVEWVSVVSDFIPVDVDFA